MRSATTAAYLRQSLRRGLTLALLLLGAAASSAQATRSLLIQGAGFGHGVGMSQYGAYGYALHGKSYRWILGHYFQGTALSHTNPNQSVRVLVGSGTSQTISGASRAAGRRLDPSRSYTAVAAGGATVLRDSSGRRLTRVSGPLDFTGPGPLTLAGAGTYRGKLEVRPSGGELESVNAVALDQYLRGVVASEMPASWSAQALEAQAVAARSYAITTTVSGDGYDLYDDTRSQMYEGVAGETSQSDAAVSATRGQVVVYNGQPVTTYFASSSGGHTENVENAWPGATPEPWLRGVVDRYDGAGGNPCHRWSYRMSISRASQQLGSSLHGRLLAIKVTRRGVSPRVVSAQVIGSRGRTTVTGQDLEQDFGLPSTWATYTILAH